MNIFTHSAFGHLNNMADGKCSPLKGIILDTASKHTFKKWTVLQENLKTEGSPGHNSVRFDS